MSRVLALAAIALLGVACAAAPDDGAAADGTPTAGEDALTGTRSISLLYEGTCDFLRNCSSFSRGLPAGEVQWGCGGAGACSDTAHWVAGPSHSYCGKTVKFCKGATCTTAVVKDVSNVQGWEGSNGVMEALGLAHGLSSRCSGFGGGHVTMSIQ